MAWDFNSHHAAAVIQAAKANAFELVFMLPYSPDLNPIEFTWESIKRVISIATIRSIDELRRTIRMTFAEASQHRSHAKAWIQSFVPSAVSYKRVCEWL
nr:transposase [uncultured Thiohalocapsa sp.]